MADSMALLINLAYALAAVLFIVGLKMLGSPATARRGNLISAVAMFIAVVVTLFDRSIVDFEWIALGVVIGTVIGVLAARMVAMTKMPEMVALFNGFGGLASLAVGWAALFTPNTLFTLITIALSILIGGVTFTGSMLPSRRKKTSSPDR